MAFESKVLTDLESFINNTLSSRKAELKTLSERAEEAKAQLATYTEQMTKATEAGDVEGYRKAKAKRSEVEDALEMFQSRMDALTKKPLIDKTDYEMRVKSVYAEVDAIDNRVRESFTKHADEMLFEAEELKDLCNRANAILHGLQEDLYLNLDRTKSQGSYLHFDKKKVDKGSTLTWGYCAAEHYQYKETTGRVGHEQEKRIF